MGLQLNYNILKDGEKKNHFLPFLLSMLNYNMLKNEKHTFFLFLKHVKERRRDKKKR